MQRPNLVFFGWPGEIGGADTKLAHLLLLLHKHAKITVVPNFSEQLNEVKWADYLKQLGIDSKRWDELPTRMNGFAIALSNQCFFTHSICRRAKESGLKVVWSSEMMWHHEGELQAVADGLVDIVLYVSDVQKAALSPGYGKLPAFMTGNFIAPSLFPFAERSNPVFRIGRLSRPAPEKYPEDFPVFYEALELPETTFRVMAWGRQLAEKYRWHRFDQRWELLGPAAVPAAEFLQSLDLFVYPLGHGFTESWGRSTVEAMLTGAVPLVPPGHHIDQLILDGCTGFFCDDFMAYHEHAHRLRRDVALRRRISRQCHEHAVAELCREDEHRRQWMEIFR